MLYTLRVARSARLYLLIRLQRVEVVSCTSRRHTRMIKIYIAITSHVHTSHHTRILCVSRDLHAASTVMTLAIPGILAGFGNL